MKIVEGDENVHLSVTRFKRFFMTSILPTNLHNEECRREGMEYAFCTVQVRDVFIDLQNLSQLAVSFIFFK